MFTPDTPSFLPPLFHWFPLPDSHSYIIIIIIIIIIITTIIIIKNIIISGLDSTHLTF
jgi:hypothetical protein